MRERLAGIPGEIWDGSGDNPYFAYLAVADALIVTANSVSMVSEAAATGKPVHVVDLPGGDAKFARFHEAMRQAGITRPFAGEIEDWHIRPPDDTARAGAMLRQMVDARCSHTGTRPMKQAGFYAGLWLLLGLLLLLVPGDRPRRDRSVLRARPGVSARRLGAAGGGRGHGAVDHPS